MFRPPPPMKYRKPLRANLRFAFWPVAADEQLVDTVSKSIENGAVTVSFTAKNEGNAQADNGQIWIQICDACKFAEEPEGTTVPPGEPIIVRRKRFDILHMGSYFDGTTLKIVPPSGVPFFTIAFKYACERCPSIDNNHPQKLRINLN